MDQDIPSRLGTHHPTLLSQRNGILGPGMALVCNTMNGRPGILHSGLVPAIKKDVDWLDRAQRETTKMSKGGESLACGKRLRELEKRWLGGTTSPCSCI